MSSRRKTSDHPAADARATATEPARSTEHVDVLIVGAGLSGIGAACHLQTNCPGKTLRDPRGARRDRRHLGPVPLSRASARTPTCTRSATRSSRGRRPKAIADGPSILDYVRETAASTASSARSASAIAWCAPSGRRATRAGRSRPSAPTAGETVRMTCGFLFAVQRLLPLRRGLHAGVRGHRALRGRDRPPAALARGPRLRRQARRRDRQRRDRGDARAGDGRARRARDDAAALAELRRLAARAQDPIADFLRRGCREARVPARALEERAARRRSSSSSAAARRADQAADPQGRRAQAAARATTSTRTSSRATTRGTSASASSPTATSSRRSPTGSASVVTDRSRPSPRRAPARVRRGARGRPDRHRDRAQPAAARRIEIAVDGERARAARDASATRA